MWSPVTLQWSAHISHMYVLWATGFRGCLRDWSWGETVCCLWPVDAPRLWFWSHSSWFLWSACGGSRVTLSHPSQGHILDTNSSSIMQWRREISCLHGCGQDNMVTGSVHYASSLGQGSGFVAKLFRGPYSQLTPFVLFLWWYMCPLQIFSNFNCFVLCKDSHRLSMLFFHLFFASLLHLSLWSFLPVQYRNKPVAELTMQAVD